MEEKTNEMLSFDAFVYVLNKLSDALQNLKNRMRYREIVIKNKYGVESPIKRNYGDTTTVQNDPEYTALVFQYEVVDHRIKYLNETGCMPPDCHIKIPNWMHDDTTEEN